VLLRDLAVVAYAKFFVHRNFSFILTIMPRHPLAGVALDDAMEVYREKIVALRQAHYKVKDIVAVLEEEEGLKISQGKFHRYLKLWNAQIQRQPLTDDQIQLGVIPLAQTTLQSDTKIASNLSGQLDIDISHRQVKRARLKYRAIKTIPNPIEREQRRMETTLRIDELIHRGGGLLHGRQWAVSHLRRHQGYRAFRDDVAAAQREIDPDGVRARLLRKRTRYENLFVSGPDYMWSLDGHDKLLRFGIQIYGAVDAYSRKILWWYVGNSNKTQISVVRQFINAVRVVGRVPNYLRTDIGTECAMLADCQFGFYLMHGLLIEGWSNDVILDQRLSDCYMQGKSTENVRIERLWKTQGHTTTWVWIDYFTKMTRDEYFDVLQGRKLRYFYDHSEVDKVIINYIFMPILRQYIGDFVLTYNGNPIRRQKGRKWHVPGVPDELYETEELRSGIPANLNLLNTWDNEVNNYDFNAYITAETAQWFTFTMQELGHPHMPTIDEFIGVLGDRVPDWYMQLVSVARHHARTGTPPILALAPRPEGGYSNEVLKLVGEGLGHQELDAVRQELHELLQDDEEEVADEEYDEEEALSDAEQ
jgi:hypothetical protein